jgi:hypothetical protein
MYPKEFFKSWKDAILLSLLDCGLVHLNHLDRIMAIAEKLEINLCEITGDLVERRRRLNYDNILRCSMELILLTIASQVEDVDPEASLKIMKHKFDPDPINPKFNLKTLDADDVLCKSKEEIVADVMKEVGSKVLMPSLKSSPESRAT